jgi:hypothetical protein
MTSCHGRSQPREITVSRLFTPDLCRAAVAEAFRPKDDALELLPQEASKAEFRRLLRFLVHGTGSLPEVPEPYRARCTIHHATGLAPGNEFRVSGRP